MVTFSSQSDLRGDILEELRVWYLEALAKGFEVIEGPERELMALCCLNDVEAAEDATTQMKARLAVLGILTVMEHMEESSDV